MYHQRLDDIMINTGNSLYLTREIGLIDIMKKKRKYNLLCRTICRKTPIRTLCVAIIVANLSITTLYLSFISKRKSLAL